MGLVVVFINVLFKYRTLIIVICKVHNQYDALTRIISCFKPVRGRRDAWVWIKKQNGCFTVSSAYDSIIDHHPDLEDDAFKYLWKIPAHFQMTQSLPIEQSVSVTFSSHINKISNRLISY